MVGAHEQKEGHIGRKGRQMMNCPVCKGTGVTRAPAPEATPWTERPVNRTSGANRYGYVEEICWACGGDARLPVVDHDAAQRAS
jgi:DnaJ-class molecular chaperone